MNGSIDSEVTNFAMITITQWEQALLSVKQADSQTNAHPILFPVRRGVLFYLLNCVTPTAIFQIGDHKKKKKKKNYMYPIYHNFYIVY